MDVLIMHVHATGVITIVLPVPSKDPINKSTCKKQPTTELIESCICSVDRQ